MGLMELIEEFAVWDVEGVPLDPTLGRDIGKALKRVRGDLGGTLGGCSLAEASALFPKLGLQVRFVACNMSVFSEGRSGTGGGGSVGGMDGITRGARPAGNSMEDALR